MKPLLFQIFDLCYVIANMTDHDVSFEYVSHTDQVLIRLYENGWNREGINQPVIMKSYLDDENLNNGDFNDYSLEEIKQFLEKYTV